MFWCLLKPNFNCRFVQFQEIVLSHPAAVKAMSPGRIVIVNTPSSSNVLGVVLKTATTGSNNERIYTVLVICDKNSDDSKNRSCNSVNNSNTSKDQSNTVELVKPVTRMRLFQPEGASWHEMVQCKTENIAIVTTKTIRIDADKIINDVKKREQSRFR